jgi:hypothetical protein
MLKKLTFSYDDLSLDKIKNEYFLNNLVGNDYIETDNIASSIKTIHFYSDLMSQGILDEFTEKMLAREVLILNFSVIEALLSSVTKKIQDSCHVCKHHCVYYSESLRTAEKSKITQLSIGFMERTKILALVPRGKVLFEKLRSLRNEVHIIKSNELFRKHQYYTLDYCRKSTSLMQSIFIQLNQNYTKFTDQYHCPRR